MKICKIELPKLPARLPAMTPTTSIAFPFHLPTAQVAWDLVICHQYPIQNVASQLKVSQEELRYMLLVLAIPWEQNQIN